MRRSLLGVWACSFVLGGCGAGAALAISAGGGGGGGSKKAPPPPRVELARPSAAANFVALSYDLRDPQVKPNAQRPGGDADPRVHVFPQFRSKTGVTWFDMTEAQVAETQGTRALPLGQHVFVWNTMVDLGPLTGPVVIRVTARYEDAEGIARTFRTREVEVEVDNRLASTVLGPGVGRTSDVDTFPVDMRPDGAGFIVADLGANIVERVDLLGQVVRLAGFGVPGASDQDGVDPGVAKLPTLVNFDVDAAGNLYTNHRDRLLVTNRGTVPLVFGLVDGPDADTLDDTVVVAPHTISKADIPALQQSRGARFHPSGALLLTSQISNADYVVLAVNPQDPASPASTSITLGTTVIGPGETKVIVGGGADRSDGAAGTAARVEDANALAVGPDGEIYYVERSLSLVRVLNSTSAPLTLGDSMTTGRIVAPGAVDTVAGGGAGTALGDHGPARGARLSAPGAIDVSSDRVLFVADTNNLRVRAVNLGATPRTFAGTTIDPSVIETVVGGGTGEGGTGGVGSRATDLILRTPNAVACVGTDELLVADSLLVILVNGGTGTVNAFGKTAGPARTATVYDATNRSGPPLSRPRAAHIADARSTNVFFTDRTTVRVLNVSAEPSVVGGAKADAGGTAIVGGGSVPGFSGDAGSARSAAFDTPSALATDGPFKLYVADTGNDRVRCVNIGDPLLVGPKTAFGVSIAAGNVDTIVGGATGPLPADGDGLAPRACSLSGPLGVAVSSTGLLFIADTGHHRIRCVNPGPSDTTVAGVPVAANTIATVVGGGVAGFTPDGAGPWLVDTPTAVAVVGQTLYFSEAGNARIRALNFGAAADPDAAVAVPPNEIATIAGSGLRGNGGDGGLGTDARIDTPQALFVVTKDGKGLALIFSDGPQHVVRLVNLVKSDLTTALDPLGKPATTVPGGSIVSLAGGPNTPGTPNFPSFDGDGREAAAMRVSDPWGVVVTMKGDVLSNLFLMDQGNDRVRRVGPPPVRSSDESP
jgi:hypothetical protein